MWGDRETHESAMSKRIYPTSAQIRRVARQAQDIGITRVGALAVSPNGLIWIFDASLARHAADSADEDGESALRDLERETGASEDPFARVERRLADMKARKARLKAKGAEPDDK